MKSLKLVKNVDDGVPTLDTFDVVLEDVPVLSPDQDGAVLLQLLALSADPYMRGGLRTGRSKPGEVVSGFVVGRVLASNTAAWVTGDLFGAALSFTTIQVITAEHLALVPMWKLTGYVGEDKMTYGLGVFGMPGATAYGGLIDGKLVPGVGVGQVWVRCGCRSGCGCGSGVGVGRCVGLEQNLCRLPVWCAWRGGKDE